MPSAHINPQQVKIALHDAVDIGKETGSNPVFPYVGVTLAPDGIQAYGRSQYAVGWSFSSGLLTADHSNTVLIEHDEAKELGMAVGKTSAAKDATVWVEITDDHRLIVAYGNDEIADLPSIEPEPGDIEGINEDVAILDQAGTTPRTQFAMGLETIKRFTKVRGKSPYMDLQFTDIGNTTFVKIGDGFIGGFEAIDRPSVQDPMLFD
ncbi:hypothetical protein [Brevibacterium sp. CFH 10365]|uniref:hypothetical protein n=1 Tax=Brevibacterium sp. CFH 10365 TaxID=2585207 RepID=UPI0012663343|nr:hypothetical protein [Brevibacterium sp. CFH 10365]